MLGATPEHMEELTIEHVNHRRLRDNLCISVRRDDSRCVTLGTTRNVPRTCREHVNHLIEGHWAKSRDIRNVLGDLNYIEM